MIVLLIIANNKIAKNDFRMEVMRDVQILKKTFLTKVQRSNETSICTMVKDENDMLLEWTAYHYHMINLRHLIVCNSKTSTTSPLEVLDRWKDMGLKIEVLKKRDYAPWHCRGRTTNNWYANYLSDQKCCVETCIRHFKEQNRKWAFFIDPDEYITFNPVERDDSKRIFQQVDRSNPDSSYKVMHNMAKFERNNHRFVRDLRNLRMEAVRVVNRQSIANGENITKKIGKKGNKRNATTGENKGHHGRKLLQETNNNNNKFSGARRAIIKKVKTPSMTKVQLDITSSHDLWERRLSLPKNLDSMTIAEYMEQHDFAWNDLNCIAIPRVQFGGLQESNKTILNNNIPTNFNPKKFLTLSYFSYGSKNSYRYNKWPKCLVDISKLQEMKKVKNIHMIVSGCKFAYHDESLFRIHHYVARKKRQRLNNNATDDRAALNYERTHSMQGWLLGFITKVGVEKARFLLDGIGDVENMLNTSIFNS